MRLRILLLTLMLLALAAPALAASIDLINPEDDLLTNSTSLTFDYRPSMPGLLSCTIHAGPFDFIDPSPTNNGISTVVVQNVEEGTHLWNVSCTNSTATILSASTREFTIDTAVPIMTLTGPVAGNTYERIPVSLSVTDGQSAEINCEFTWEGTVLETVTIANATTFTKEYAAGTGSGTFRASCKDGAGNVVREDRTITLEPMLYLFLTTDKEEYGLTDPVRLTIDTVPGSDVQVDICPNQQGFVQCTSAIIGSTDFPQTITLPYLNKTGEYLVEGLSSYNGETRINQTTYTLENTISVQITKDGKPRIGRPLELGVDVSGGIAPYTLEWDLSNGTIISGQSTVTMDYDEDGNYTEKVTVTDFAQNVKTAQIEFIIEKEHEVLLKVIDNETLQPVRNIEVEFAGDLEITDARGEAFFNVTTGTHRLFITTEGYDYLLLDQYINRSVDLTVRLTRNKLLPKITIVSPAGNATVQPAFKLQYKTENLGIANCTLFRQDEGNWFMENGTSSVSNGLHEMSRTYPVGDHTVKLECTGNSGAVESSESVTFSVAAAAEAQEIVEEQPKSADYFKKEIDLLTTLIEGLGDYGPEEKELSEIILFDKDLRNVKRALLQATRDLNDIQFRADLDDAGKQKERDRIVQKTEALYATTPVTMSIIKKRNFVKYAEEDEIGKVLGALIDAEVLEGDEKSLAKILLDDQQKFTISTELYHVEYTYPDTKKKTVTVVIRKFTYAEDLEDEYSVYEIIPKEIAEDADDLKILGRAEIVEKDPILRFDQVGQAVYIIPKRIDFTKMELVITILTRPYVAEGTLTGFAILPGMDVGSWGMPAIILAIILIAAYLAYYFDLFKQIGYIRYKLGKNEQVHYVRVLISDAEDNLSANDYERADLLYKEIRMTYEKLSMPGKNELYEDMMDLVRKMDVYYFNMIMVEMDGHLKHGDFESAIASYEKLTGTFERLDKERQEQLVERVTQMARRLGVTA